MLTISANDAKQSLGRILDTAQREPVIIQRHNRDVAVLISPQEYDRLRAFNLRELKDLCDRARAEAVANGLTEERLAELLADE